MKTSYVIAAIFTWLCLPLLAQEQYVVTTLLPENSNHLDDGLAMDENGTIYGSYWGIWQGAVGTHLLRYRPNGMFDTLATGLNRPNGIAYHRGQLYIANSGTNQLVIMDTTGENRSVISVPGGISNALFVPGTDSLVMVAWNQNRILGLTSNGEVATVAQSSLLNGPVGAAYDTAGNLYIGNYNDGRILKYHDGQVEVFANIGGGMGFLTYADNALLATNHTDKKVYRITIADQSVKVIAGSGTTQITDGIGEAAAFRFPNGIQATASGDTIYVSEFDGKALRMIVRTNEVVQTIEEGDLTNKVQLFPLPAINTVTINGVDQLAVQEAHLFNISGKLVTVFSKEDVLSGQLALANIPAGTYLLKGVDKQQRVLFTAKLPIVK